MVEVPLAGGRDALREEMNLVIDMTNKLFDRVYELERKVRILEGKGSIIKDVPP